MGIDARKIRDLINFARTNSPCHRDLYQKVPIDVSDLEMLPVTDGDEYLRQASQSSTKVLTGPFTDGSILRSGGSTNAPKTCFMTRQELTLSGILLGAAWVKAGLVVPGDRIANLYSFGGMYGGFQYMNRAIEEAPIPVVHLPLSSNCPLDQVQREIDTFQATVVMASVFHITRLANQITNSGNPARSVRTILFAGEKLSNAVAATWQAAFPSAVIRPSLYASVDSGGMSVLPQAAPDLRKQDLDIATDPVYGVLQEATVVELLADDGSVIREPGIPGHVFVTSLIRRLQPVIRYSSRTFRYLGRGSRAVKIVSSWLDLAMLKKLVGETLGTDVDGHLQCIIRHEGLASVLVFRLALLRPVNEDSVREQIDAKLRQESLSWQKSREEGRIIPLQFEWVDISRLVLLESGKLKEVLDERV
ncbi:hypothetical protein QBC46DRAFT_362540 [Diplogelasinospora grovesii]|uniref:AMP-dependent synthetase/ligase domain-containing protein n=1 Tax=Diplogelasinospora grovesii TaxID=303347 RepID=A0AAN6NB64_9PEZI|nr:hypothetical protein QBC46DRAFT_362540 [Diplogelasinospora grovesii]